MGVELNFLEKEKRGLNPGQLIATVFAGILLVASGALWLQWHTAQNVAEVAASEQALAQARQGALAIPGADGERTDDAVQAISVELATIKEESLPHAQIYTELTAALGEGVTLHTFDSSDGRLVQLSATFIALEDVAAARGRLEQLPYVRSVRESDASQSAGGYNAGLTVQIDESGLRGESVQP